ncbi:MAG: RsmB/NOP family class I SAM-dependent RNA methyltransferase [Rhodothermales bacterium]
MIPAEFLHRLKDIVSPADYASVEASMHQPKATSFRVNTLRSSVEEVLTLLAAEGIIPESLSWYPEGMWVSHDQRANLLASKAFTDHKIYVQNQSSMIPPLILDPQPGERVLDLAAAPGSKTLQLACLMQQKGEIAAVDAVKKRFFKLRDNLLAQGATEVNTYLKDGRGVWKHRPEYFDRVLLDAPCSSEGRFHISEPGSYAYWSKRKVKEMARKQKRLLYSAVNSARPGGTVVYSTCSYAPEENEAIVSHLVKRFGGVIEVVPFELRLDTMTDACLSWAGKSFNDTLLHARRILPSYHTDGFFICKLKKHSSTIPQFSQVK